MPALAERYAVEFEAFNVFSVIVFTIEYVLRVWSSVEIPMLSRLPRWQARLALCDAADDDHRPARLFPWYLHWMYPWTFGCSGSSACSVCSSSSATRLRLQTLGRVLADEYRALLGALLVILVLLLFSPTAMYFSSARRSPISSARFPMRRGGRSRR